MFSLALSGGGLLGAAHLGVLDVLHEEGMSPLAVAGASAGGLVASMWALDVPIHRMIDFGRQVTRHPTDYFDLNWRGIADDLWAALGSPATGLLSPARFVKGLLALSPQAQTTDDWRHPCAIVSVDIAGLCPVAFTQSNTPPPSAGWQVQRHRPLMLALSATMALPGLFEAPRVGPSVLVDGGVTDTVPADWAYALSAEPVVAVNVAQALPENGSYFGIAEVLARSEAFCTQASAQLRARHLPVFTIAPDTRHVPFFGFHDYDRLIEAGRQAAFAALPNLRQFLGAR